MASKRSRSDIVVPDSNKDIDANKASLKSKIATDAEGEAISSSKKQKKMKEKSGGEFDKVVEKQGNRKDNDISSTIAKIKSLAKTNNGNSGDSSAGAATAVDKYDEQEKEIKDDENEKEDEQEQDESEEITFESLGIHPSLIKACEEIGWKSPTPVQKQAIPYVMKGRDVIALAETGSGKTGAFALPVLHNLFYNPQPLFCVVLAPTRELAVQINDVFTKVGNFMGAKSICIVGGVDQMSQAVALAKKPHIIVASPGRLIDHLENSKGFSLRTLKMLVLDEADRMLSMDFEESINKLLTVIPRERITLLFSATMTTKVEKLQRASLRPNPAFVTISAHKYHTVDTLVQQIVVAPAKLKDCWLVYLLTEFTGQSSIIFTLTCAHAQRLSMMLHVLGMSSICLHGKLTQKARINALQKFKNGGKKIMVATSVASRGLDIPNVDLVINYDVPENPKDYVHQVGRTARAGRSGHAITIVSQYDLEEYQKIEHSIGKKLPTFAADKELVLVLLDRVIEAQRLASIEMKDNKMSKVKMT